MSDIPKDCGLCKREFEFELIEFNGIRVIAPQSLHNAGVDGGHLIVLPVRHINSRWEAVAQEFAAMHVLSYVARNALAEACAATWWNLQENGNWGLGRSQGPHMHLHVYGRSAQSARQPFGEALVLPKRNSDGSILPWYSVNEWDRIKCVFQRVEVDHIAEATTLWSTGNTDWRGLFDRQGN